MCSSAGTALLLVPSVAVAGALAVANALAVAGAVSIGQPRPVRVSSGQEAFAKKSQSNDFAGGTVSAPQDHVPMDCADFTPLEKQIPIVTGIELAYPRLTEWDTWWMPERAGPQAAYHQRAVAHLRSLLEAFVVRQSRKASVARELAIRFVEAQPRIGVAPDICVLDPAPLASTGLASLCLWKPGHVRPPLCIEVVNHSQAHKNYATIHERYAFMHAAEVVLFDPTLAGPKTMGGPVPLQLWRRSESGTLARVSHGAQPAYCQYLDAWLIPERQLLEIADDREGRGRWSPPPERKRYFRPKASALDANELTPGRPGTPGLTLQP